MSLSNITKNLSTIIKSINSVYAIIDKNVYRLGGSVYEFAVTTEYTDHTNSMHSSSILHQMVVKILKPTFSMVEIIIEIINSKDTSKKYQYTYRYDKLIDTLGFVPVKIMEDVIKLALFDFANTIPDGYVLLETNSFRIYEYAIQILKDFDLIENGKQ